MREALKRLTAESLIYGLGQVSGRAVQLLLVPILTRALTRDVYGVADLVMAYAQFATLTLVFGMDGALVRFLYQEPDAAARRRMISTSLQFRVLVSVACALGLALLAAPLTPVLTGSEAYRKYVMVGALTLPFTLVGLFANDVLRVTFQPWKFIALNLSQTLVTGVVSLWLVLGRDMGVAGVLYGKLAGDAFAAAFGLVLMRHSLVPAFDRAVLARMLSYGAPLVPASIAYGIVGSADRYFLQRTRGLAEVGEYAVAIKFFSVAMMGVSAFSLAFFPFAHARSADPGAPRLYARALDLYVVVASFTALGISLFAPEALSLLVPATYHDAAWPAALLSFAAVAYGAYYVACLGLQFALRTAWLGWIAAGAALTAVAAHAVLTPRWGSMGAATATWIGNVTLAMATYVAAQAVHRLPYRGPRALGLFVVATGAAVMVPRMAPAGLGGAGIKLATLAGFAGVGGWLAVRRPTAGAGRS